MPKRYAIVRVDNKCPVVLEEDISTVDRIKMFDCIGKRQCGDCRYGDTKEQLIRKIEQVIFKNFKNYNGFMARYLTSHLVIFAYKIAKEIVEFLGVEE